MDLHEEREDGGEGGRVSEGLDGASMDVYMVITSRQ